MSDGTVVIETLGVERMVFKRTRLSLHIARSRYRAADKPVSVS